MNPKLNYRLFKSGHGTWPVQRDLIRNHAFAKQNNLLLSRQISDDSGRKGNSVLDSTHDNSIGEPNWKETTSDDFDIINSEGNNF